MTQCPVCNTSLTMTKCSCPACKMQYEGMFALPRLARLDHPQGQLAEALILHGGNLKEMSESLGISYPTLKKRLAELSNRLAELKLEDDARIEQILHDIELGKTSAEEGIRMIREINHEL